MKILQWLDKHDHISSFLIVLAVGLTVIVGLMMLKTIGDEREGFMAQCKAAGQNYHWCADEYREQGPPFFHHKNRHPASDSGR